MIRLLSRTPGRTVAIAAAAVAVASLRNRSLRWGATDGEQASVLPGDEVLGPAQLVSTRAITIRSSPEDVWPWIAQLGQGRGGFYSYDFLENLVGCDIHSASAVIDGWQDVAVGDAVKLHPGAPPCRQCRRTGASTGPEGWRPDG